MTVIQYDINNVKFAVIHEENKILIYMDVNKEIKINKEIKDGIIRKIIICKTKISLYICNAIVETKNRIITEDFLKNIYMEVVEASDNVI